jgi:hypothetical protein
MKNFIKELHTRHTFSLPAGRYWIGDPCYAIRGDDWFDFLNVAEDDGTNTYKDDEFLVVSTGGDGGWDYNGEHYFVDAGMLAVIPIALVDEYANNKGVFIDLTDDSEVGYITNDFGLMEVFAGEVTVAWATMEDEDLVMYAYDYDNTSVITTKELFEAYVVYTQDEEDEEAEAAIKEELPQFVTSL